LNDKILSYVGLATRSRNCVGGEFSTEKAIKEKKARLVIVATDASDNTKKNFNDSCTFYKVPIIIYGTKEELGKATGNQIRASVAVLDEGFADSILKNYDGRKAENNG
jgi:ribosomal protein L7Ae-like RNA K-turn-binding protein